MRRPFLSALVLLLALLTAAPQATVRSVERAAAWLLTPSAAYSQAFPSPTIPVTPGGRCTGTSGSPRADTSNITTIFYAPDIDAPAVAPKFTGSHWENKPFAQVSIALGTLTSGKGYDVFLVDGPSGWFLEFGAAYTNDTTRADAVVQQDGLWVKSANKTRLLVCSFYTSSTTQTQDSVTNRYLSNVYRQVERGFLITGSASHSYGTTTFRSWNTDTTLRLQYLVSIASVIRYQVNGNMSISGTEGITTACVGCTNSSSSNALFVAGVTSKRVGGGTVTLAVNGPNRNFIQLIEWASGTVTFVEAHLVGTILN